MKEVQTDYQGTETDSRTTEQNELALDPMLAPDPRPRKSKRKKDAEPVAEAVEVKPRKKGFGAGFMAVLSGNILTRQEVRKVYPFLLFIAFLAFIYIGNVFRTQQLYRRQSRLRVEVKELRAKSLTIASHKMDATRRARIIEEIDRRGLPLRESLTPAKIIRRDSIKIIE